MKVSDLRGILQYVPRFRDRIFVVAIDGEVIGSSNFSNILLDLAVLRSLSIKVIIVHGASAQIVRLAAERGIAISNADGTGITDDRTLKIGIEAASNILNEVMQGLTSVDLRAVYANAIVAHPAGILGGVDFLHTGRVERVDVKSLHLFLNEGITPVIPPMGFDGEGRTFRVNSDGIALAVAEAMNAMKIIYLSAGNSLVVNGEIVKQLSIPEAEDIVKKRRLPLTPGTYSKLDNGARACRLGVPRVHLLDGLHDEALLSEVFSHEGIGTMIYSNEYQQIRRLLKKDVRGVMALMALATSSAMPSEFTRNVRPSPSKPIGGMTGVMPSFRKRCSIFASTRSTRPVWRKSTPPRMPAGCAMMAFAYTARRSTDVRPCITSLRIFVAASMPTFSVRSSVIPVPSALVIASPRSAARLAICALAPWTMMTLMLSERSTARSSRIFAKFGEPMISPSIATTKIRSRNLGTY